MQSEEFTTWVANVVAWLTTNLPIAIQFISDVWKNVLFPAIQAIIPVLQTVMEAIGKFLSTVQGWWDDHGEQVIRIVQFLWDTIKQRFETFRDMFQGIFDLFSLAMQGKWTEFGQKLREILDKSWMILRPLPAMR